MRTLPGELIFIGLGLHDQYGLSLCGQAEAKSCSMLFAEFYTNPMPALDMKYLSGLVGKQVTVLSRSQVEEHAQEVILSKAAIMKVGFLVPGDPMVATTHVDLRLRAYKAGIKTRIIHAASVISAVAGSTGLQSYKFGRTVTIPVSRQGEFPESIYEAIKGNLALGLHSLVLMEVDVENKRHVRISEALEQLAAVSKLKPDADFGPGTLVVGISRLGAPDMQVHASTVSELAQMDFGRPPYLLVIPSHLHFVEAEALQAFCGASKELVTGKA